MKINVKRFEYLDRQVVVSEVGKKYGVAWAYDGEITEPFELFPTIENAVEGAKAEIDSKVKYEVRDGNEWFTPKTAIPRPEGQLYYALEYCNIGLAKKGEWRVKWKE